MKFRTCVLLLSLLLVVGCASTKATFEVAVKNATNGPLSVGLVKLGGKVEPGWDGPEHVAIHAPMLADRKWGTLIEPGAVVTLGPQSGNFVQGERAVLRVYAADATIDELMGYSQRDSARLDINLWPGSSGYVIERDVGELKYRPVQLTPKAAATAQR
jgi:hypothetical protein